MMRCQWLVASMGFAMRPYKRRLTTLFTILFTITCFYLYFDFASVQHIPLDRIISDHPIAQLHYQNTKQLQDRLASQSQTLQAAIDVYKQRHHHDPPPGFSEWFAYARKSGTTLIDDYAAIASAFESYIAFSGHTLQELVHQTIAELPHHLHVLRIPNPHKDTESKGWMIPRIAKDIGPQILKRLPPVTILFNGLDEPRVLPSRIFPGAATFQDRSHTNVSSLLIAQCPTAHHAAASGPNSDTDQESASKYALPFLDHVSRHKDLCENPAHASRHGFLQSPVTLHLTSAPVPIFSPCKISVFGDILAPGPFYSNRMSGWDYKGFMDRVWRRKSKTLYWRGSTTGMYVSGKTSPMTSDDDELDTDPAYRHGHRQRFVEAMSRLSSKASLFYAKDASGHWTPEAGERVHDELQGVADVAFTDVVQCTEQACRQQRTEYSYAEHENKENGYSRQLLFDLDGNGFSGRFYTQLESRSCVLKQTIFQEWHDEKVVPWVHYVPVSLGMEELPEILRYLTKTDEGQRIAERIASAGREWRKTVLRPVDFRTYWYRLILEYARVMDVKREAGSYDV